MKALIDPSDQNLVKEVSETTFDVSLPLFWVDCPDGTLAGTTKYVDGQFSLVNPPEPTSIENQDKARFKLQQSDFAVLPDVNLTNKAEWETYRAELRQIATNPTSGNLMWPTKPQTIWG